MNASLGVVAQGGRSPCDPNPRDRIEDVEISGEDIIGDAEIEPAGIQAVTCGPERGLITDRDAATEIFAGVADRCGRRIDGGSHPAASDAAGVGVPSEGLTRRTVTRTPSVLAESIRRGQVELGGHHTGVLAHLNLPFAGDGVVGARTTTGYAEGQAHGDGNCFGAAVDLLVVRPVPVALIRRGLDGDGLRGREVGVVADRAAYGLMGVGFALGPGDGEREACPHPQPGTHRVGVDRVLAGGGQADALGSSHHTIPEPGLQFGITGCGAEGAVGLEIAEAEGRRA